MAFIIPTEQNLYDYVEQVDLEGVTYTLRFWWSFENLGWYMTIGLPDGTPIIGQVRVTVNYALAWRFGGLANMPPGLFFAIDTTGQGVDPGIDDLGSRVVLYYFTQAERAAAGA